MILDTGHWLIQKLNCQSTTYCPGKHRPQWRGGKGALLGGGGVSGA